MARKIICIYTTTTNPVRYVQNTYERSDKTIAVELTDNPNLAEDFETKNKAEEIISNLFNPFDRKYKAKEISVKQPVRIGSLLSELK